ncbi:MAG: hypothetical protein F6K54_07565, partial [Okeania sp. SIO3B5]|uniref:hypothetical protein n=1 Tax=Okeania sp. SIO3B5 TaxID=2607811 RepID=UPI0013FFB13A
SSISQATDFLGETPSFWGRYFEGPFGGRCTDPQPFTSLQYEPSQENQPLSSSNIALLPVASSTLDVSSSSVQCAQKDAQVQAQTFLKDLGENNLASQGKEFYIFLDVEESEPPLNPTYYLAWSQAIQNASTSEVKLLPGVYMSVADNASAEQLNSSIAGGAICSGLWIAGYPYAEGWQGSLPSWNEGYEATPETPVNCPVLIWQFAQNLDTVFDLDMLNPQYAEQTLHRLAVPPSSTF